MADEIVFTFQCLGIRGCVRARPAVSDLQSLWVLAVRSEEMSVVVFAGTCVRAKRACFCACAWQWEREKAWKWDSELKRLMSKNSVCSLSANCQPSITIPTHGLCKKRLESWACVCVCRHPSVRMSLGACLCVSSLITQRLGFVTLDYLAYSCMRSVMCYMSGWQSKRGRDGDRRHIRTRTEPLSFPTFHTSYFWRSP